MLLTLSSISFYLFFAIKFNTIITKAIKPIPAITKVFLLVNSAFALNAKSTKDYSQDSLLLKYAARHYSSNCSTQQISSYV